MSRLPAVNWGPPLVQHESLDRDPRPRTSAEWETLAKRLLRIEMAQCDVDFAELALRLRRLGVVESAEDIADKVNAGQYNAVFLVQCLAAMKSEMFPSGG